jgi:hypothetical protein
MSETIVPAKPDQRIWILSGSFGNNPFQLIDVIAWVVSGPGRPIPITAYGRFDPDRPYVLSGEAGWIAVPDGTVLTDSHDVRRYLEACRGN